MKHQDSGLIQTIKSLISECVIWFQIRLIWPNMHGGSFSLGKACCTVDVYLHFPPGCHDVLCQGHSGRRSLTPHHSHGSPLFQFSVLLSGQHQQLSSLEENQLSCISPQGMQGSSALRVWVCGWVRRHPLTKDWSPGWHLFCLVYMHPRFCVHYTQDCYTHSM